VDALASGLVGQQPVMVSAISQLGHALHLDLVAEGIEQPEQVSALRGLACQYGQGFYFARPLPPDALAELLRRQVDEPGWNLLQSEQPADPRPALTR
jgi:EAL domain-containing protein (putative c-di-GMP-specific phosphodiesterase class I)